MPKPLAVVLALLFCFSFANAQASSNKKEAPAADAPVVHDGDSPAYHEHAPDAAKLPRTLNPDQFNDPRVRNAYAMAAKVRRVLYVQPCYCYCDKGFGHKSLLDCFASTHGAECGVCMQEAIFTYQQTKAGKTPGEIRAAIKRGEFRQINLNDYLTARVY